MIEETKNGYYFRHEINDRLRSMLKEEADVCSSFALLDQFMKEEIENQKCQDSFTSSCEFLSLKGYYHIGKNVNIAPFVSIEGPVYIGDNVTISSHALIRPFTYIGDGCVIGHAAEIKHSILCDQAKVQSFTFVGDSVVGYGARVGSGTILSNRRFDQKEISLSILGQTLSTNSSFFGCILGDYARLGAGCVTLPGTLIGPYTFVHPNIVASGFIQEGVVCRRHASSLIIEEKEKQELL